MRPQEDLGKKDIEQLIATEKKFGKSNSERDVLMIELMYRHRLDKYSVKIAFSEPWYFACTYSFLTFWRNNNRV